MAKTIHFFVYSGHRVRYHLASYPGSSPVSLHGEEPGYEANTTCKKILLAQYKRQWTKYALNTGKLIDKQQHEQN